MLADKLGKSDAGTRDSPCTLQLPETSRLILMRKFIVVGLCSMHDALMLLGSRVVDRSARQCSCQLHQRHAAVQILTRKRVPLLESDQPISFRAETGADIIKKP
jgi:hypothetical protein